MNNQNKSKQEMKKEDDRKIKVKDWNDVESPNFFKFETIGDKVTGTILSRDQSARYGFGLYAMRLLDEDKQIRFHGSSQLDDLLQGIDLPALVQIEYIDEQETPNGSMKLFKVRTAVL